MFKKYWYNLRKSDWWLSMIAVFLTAFGLMTIYSIEAARENSDFTNFKKQLIFFAIGIILMLFFSLLDYRFIKTTAIAIFVIGIIILLIVLIGGTTVKGTRGWLYFFGTQGFQPVELIKIVIIVILAKFFSDWRGEVATWKRFAFVSLVAGALFILVVLQPDFGSAFILAIIFLGMLLLTKIRRLYIITLCFLIFVIVVSSWLFVLKDYQKERVINFLNPSHDPYGSGYNIKQSIIAVGSGMLFGRGLSFGSQSRLNFLPAQETDFIFAVIAEELGLIGAGLLIVLVFGLVYRLFKIIRLGRDDFGIFIVGGVIIYFFSQNLLNIGMNIGLVPIAGVPLPFVSYGGSSLIASFIMIGIVQSVCIRFRSAVSG